MNKFDVIIIGTGPAGIISGVTAKKQNPEKNILMIGEEKRGLVPCGIPYIFHRLNDISENAMGPKPFVDAGGKVVNDLVVKVDTENHTVKTASGVEYTYDKLVFASGSKPVEPKFIPGYDLQGVEYIKKSYNYIESILPKVKSAKNVVVVGGGFIGAEVAEQLQLDGKNVSLVEVAEQCFSKAFSTQLSTIATEQLRKAGVNVHTSAKVAEVIGDNGNVKSVKLASGEVINADIVIMSVGYRPNTQVAKEAGLELNTIGAIKVDNYGRTNIDGIFAVGDCSSTIGFLTGRQDAIMLASTATAEARVLGYNLFSIKIKRPFAGTLAVFSTEINNLSMAASGVNENSALEANVDFEVGEFSDVDRHPGKINDSSTLSVKLYASKSDGSILGGEVWGGKSAGEIINIISLAIQKGVTVYELVSFQVGTHPLLTTAPTKYVLIKAAENIISKIMNC